MPVVESIAVSIAIFSSALSIAVSVKDLMKSRSISLRDAIELYRKETTDKERELLGDPDIQAGIIEITTIISDKLLRQLAKEANECEDNHIRLRDEADSQIAKNLADIKGSECMCTVLRTIKQYNDLELPHGELYKNLWKSYNCTD